MWHLCGCLLIKICLTYNYFYLNIFQVKMYSRRRSDRPQKRIWTAVAANTARQLRNLALSGYRLFDIRPLVEFVEQFPCPTWQHSGCDATECGAVLATTMHFTCKGCGTIMKLKNTCRENINLRFQMAVYSIGVTICMDSVSWRKWICHHLWAHVAQYCIRNESTQPLRR